MRWYYVYTYTYATASSLSPFFFPSQAPFSSHYAPIPILLLLLRPTLPSLSSHQILKRPLGGSVLLSACPLWLGGGRVGTYSRWRVEGEGRERGGDMLMHTWDN